MKKRPASRAFACSLAAIGLLLAACSDPSDEGLAELEDNEWLPGGATTNTFLLGSNAFIRPAENMLVENEALFYSGNGFFNDAWIEAPASTENRDGLGPLFNARSCSACHFKDGRGAPPLQPDEPFVGLLFRLSIEGAGPHGESLPDPVYGGQLQPFALPGVPAEAVPRIATAELPGAYADGKPFSLLEPSYAFEAFAYGDPSPGLRVSPRVAPAVIGLGLLSAITIERLEELADPDDADGDGISGRINHVWDAAAQTIVPGRFGWKAEQPSVRQQSAGAFNGDIGITSSLFPADDCTSSESECLAAPAGGSPELAEHLLDRVALYASLLAVPVRQGYDEPAVLRGKRLFREARCSACHTPSHVTDAASAFAETSGQLIWPYTDLLLHDMGERLSDDRPSFEAQGEEWRTPPLWGIGRYRDVNGHDRLLHDGRARGVAEAILWHGGEADPSRAAFEAMSGEDRAALIVFVESL